MQIAERLVVDTNVLVSAILSPDGAAREVLRVLLTGSAVPLVGNALFLEYEEVICRDHVFEGAAIGRDDREALLDAILSVCQWISVSFLWRPNLRDEADNHLVELAVAGNAGAIVTGNERDFRLPELSFDHLRVATPAEWLKARR